MKIKNGITKTTAYVLAVVMMLGLLTGLPGANLTVSATSGSCGPSLNWTFNEGTGVLEITGTGTMWDFDEDAPWWDYREDIKTVILPMGLTSIGNDAFFECINLTSVNIPVGVISIGSYAFSYCESLTGVDIPGSVTSIGDGAFMNCYLPSVTTPDGVISIGDMAFQNNRKVKHSRSPP